MGGIRFGLRPLLPGPWRVIDLPQYPLCAYRPMTMARRALVAATNPPRVVLKLGERRRGRVRVRQPAAPGADDARNSDSR